MGFRHTRVVEIMSTIAALSPLAFVAAFVAVGFLACVAVVARQAHERAKQSRLLVEEARQKVAPYWGMLDAISNGRLRFTNGGQWYYTDEKNRLVVADLGSRGSERFEVYDASDPWAQSYLRDNPPRPPDPAMASSMSRTFQLFERLAAAC